MPPGNKEIPWSHFFSEQNANIFFAGWLSGSIS